MNEYNIGDIITNDNHEQYKIIEILTQDHLFLVTDEENNLYNFKILIFYELNKSSIFLSSNILKINPIGNTEFEILSLLFGSGCNKCNFVKMIDYFEKLEFGFLVFNYCNV